MQCTCLQNLPHLWRVDICNAFLLSSNITQDFLKAPAVYWKIGSWENKDVTPYTILIPQFNKVFGLLCSYPTHSSPVLYKLDHGMWMTSNTGRIKMKDTPITADVLTFLSKSPRTKCFIFITSNFSFSTIT